MSIPLLMSHPAPATAPSVRPASAVKAAESRDGVLFSQLARRQEVALAGSKVIGVLAAAPIGSAGTTAGATTGPVTGVVSPARPVVHPAPVAPAVRANNIVIPRLGLNQPVGWYSDCLGRAPVPRWGTWRWSCAGSNNIYVMAHNPGIFTPILGLHAGDIIEYGDGSGRIHTYRVNYTTIVSNTQLWPLGATPTSSLTLQTCWTWDGSRDFIVRASEI